MRFRPGVFLLLCLAAFSLDAQTKAQQGECTFNEDLFKVPEIKAERGEINTEFHVVLKNDPNVPVWTKDLNTGVWSCKKQPFNLRNYTFPGDNRARFFPGPTLRMRKPSKPGELGDALKIDLFNDLPWMPTDQCNVGCDNCKTGDPRQCCKAKDSMPNCFHGNNTTNLHFHGTHVSPQAPQDYVLLELNPNLPAGMSPPPDHGHEGDVAYGHYQYAVDKFRYQQHEGTHWYHPHKHGSTALQVANGLAGALIIEGPFDDWLTGWYAVHDKGANLEEQVLVLQQIHDLNFVSSATVFAPLPLVNGQAQPVVHMYPGQVQRWRFIAATMEASAQLKIDFNGPSNNPVLAKQIAFDGIQFAPENYKRQPLLDAKDEFFRLSPGNRADFLVQAPKKAGRYVITYDVFGLIDEQLPNVRGPHEHRKLPVRTEREQVREMLKAVGGASGQPGLLVIQVDARPGPPMRFPPDSDWPALPPYLAPIDTVDRKVNLTFQLLNPDNTPGSPAVQPSKFFLKINDDKSKQYDPQCVDFSPALGETEEWTITQNVNNPFGAPFHVFHIHTNPFQIVQNGKEKLPEPWVWADSIPLPDKVEGEDSKVVIRQRYEDFTGRFVLHCHFLGHEDRGMMLGVQTICPGKPDQYGKAVQTGQECVTGNYIPAAERCEPQPAATTKK
jgi:FtsP/CotA-like multicopper oxidase with cupredoxin domain